jgi:hypothetical protein
MAPGGPPRSTQVKNAERQATWETLLLRSNKGKLAHGEYSSVGRLFGVDYRVVQRIWERGMATMGTRVAAAVKSRASRRGRKPKDRAAICQAIRAIPVDCRKNQRILQLLAGVSFYMIQELITKGSCAVASSRPVLSSRVTTASREFLAPARRSSPERGSLLRLGVQRVRIDKKWFYVKKVGQKLYVMTGLDVLPMEVPPPSSLQSKRYILKVMCDVLFF